MVATFPARPPVSDARIRLAAGPIRSAGENNTGSGGACVSPAGDNACAGGSCEYAGGSCECAAGSYGCAVRCKCAGGLCVSSTGDT